MRLRQRFIIPEDLAPDLDLTAYAAASLPCIIWDL
jgi:hypothetical protein